MIDIAKARSETPGCEHVIHFNNAGAGLAPEPVLTSVVNHLNLEAEIGAYEAAREQRDELERTYRAVARLIGAAEDEIALTENATRAWDMAFYSMVFEPGDRILTSVSEYGSNYLALLQVARQTGAHIEIVPNNSSGALDVEALEELVDDRVKLIAVTHVPTNGGLINPVCDIGIVARRYEIPYLVDACQSAGQLRLDVERIGCDILAATGRKYLRGPRGTGFLFVRRAFMAQLEPVFLDVHAARLLDEHHYEVRSDARKFESWESNIAARIGLGEAVCYAVAWGIDAIESRCKSLAHQLRTKLRRIDGLEIRDLGRDRCGIVTFTIKNHPATAIAEHLQTHGINVSISEAASTLLDMKRRGLDRLIRASIHYYNTEAEIDRFVEVVQEMVERA